MILIGADTQFVIWFYNTKCLKNGIDYMQKIFYDVLFNLFAPVELSRLEFMNCVDNG